MQCARRAGPALPSYLALHRAGFSVPRLLPSERWALTPPFHPCQTERAFRRRLPGFPARRRRAALRWRSILCGTFRNLLHRAEFHSAPRALARNSPCSEPACRFPGVTRRVALALDRIRRQSNVFVETVSGLSSRPAYLSTAEPAITRLTRFTNYTPPRSNGVRIRAASRGISHKRTNR